MTITLKPGLQWSDGRPVDARDVIFYLDLLRAALAPSSANWCEYSPGQLPDNVASWRASGARTVVLKLRHAVNPSWFTSNQLQDAGGGIYPLPSRAWNIASAGGPHIGDWASNQNDALAIYEYLHRQGEQSATFASNPLWKIVDGPFRLAGFSAATGSYELVPNSSYGLRPKPRADAVEVDTYSGSAAMLSAMRSGRIEIGPLDPGSQLGSIPALRRAGYSVFGGPGWGWFGGIINFRDSSDDFDKVIAQPYIRGVLAELVNQNAIIRRVYHGWAVPAYGPVPSAPRSTLIPADVTRPAHPYSPSRAVATLRAHGWNVKPGATTTCARPGLRANQCGAGIPKGTPIRFVWANLPRAVSSVGALESAIFAREARRAAGIDVRLTSRSFNFLTSNYNNQSPAAPKYVNSWGVNNYGGVYVDYYPTQQGVLSPHGSLNLGSYADPTATRLMRASVASANPHAIRDEVAYLARSYPIFFMPDQDWVTAVSRRIGGPPRAFLAMTQQQDLFQFLYARARS